MSTQELRFCPICGGSKLVLYDPFDREWLCLHCQTVTEEEDLAQYDLFDWEWFCLHCQTDTEE